MTTKPSTSSSSTASPAPSPDSRERKERPTRTIKIGSVQVAVWRNLTAEGREVFNATLERLYFDEKADKWESSQSFGRRDMLELSKAVDIAHTAMCELHEHANRRAAARPAATNTGNAR